MPKFERVSRRPGFCSLHLCLAVSPTWTPGDKLPRRTPLPFSTLVDNQTVFYVDIGGRFFLPDGSHNQEMWRFPPVSGLENVGTQAAAYVVWAEELQLWLDRFVR